MDADPRRGGVCRARDHLALGRAMTCRRSRQSTARVSPVRNDTAMSAPRAPRRCEITIGCGDSTGRRNGRTRAGAFYARPAMSDAPAAAVVARTQSITSGPLDPDATTRKSARCSGTAQTGSHTRSGATPRKRPRARAALGTRNPSISGSFRLTLARLGGGGVKSLRPKAPHRAFGQILSAAKLRGGVGKAAARRRGHG